MRYKIKETINKVKIVRLARLSKYQKLQCEALLNESGRCYSDIIVYINKLRQEDKWINLNELKSVFKGKNRYQLHSQSVQAIAEKIDANIASAKSNREKEYKELGYIKTEYPYQSKLKYSVIWKQYAINIENNKLYLSNGLGRNKLTLNVPVEYLDGNISTVELNKRAGEYYIHVTYDTGLCNNIMMRKVDTAGVDLGEVHIAAVCTDKGDCIVVSGRYLRSIKRLRNKQYKEIDQKKAIKKNKGSLKKVKKKIANKIKNKQRDILHKASRQIVDFCEYSNISHIKIGECSSTQESPTLGKKNNQKISQWTRGQIVNYITYKSREKGMETKCIPEDYSSKTCSICGHVKNSSVKGREYKCSNCKNTIHRDGNGSANICSRGRYGKYGKVQVLSIKYLQPIKLGSSSSHGS